MNLILPSPRLKCNYEPLDINESTTDLSVPRCIGTSPGVCWRFLLRDYAAEKDALNNEYFSIFLCHYFAAAVAAGGNIPVKFTLVPFI